jgi:hypothetical protein
MSREQDAFNTVVEGLAVSVKTYHHNIPTTDNPEDHSEGNCPCDPIVDDAAGTVTHQPMPAMNAASGETADSFEAALSEYVEAALDCAAHDSNQPYERLRGRRELARQQVMRLYRAAAPPTNAPEISTLLVDAPAPDAELDRLLRTFADAHHGYLLALGNGRAPYDAQEHARAAVHAYVARMKREPGNV